MESTLESASFNMENNIPKARVLTFYLPQFHPIPENDLWWGKGFTEWTNVGKAKPLFPGHYQPHVPADLGYYDLRVPETREAQANLAREYGVEGFIYWHYWFGNGKRLLDRPFREVLETGSPDFPFALAWANESWSGSFHGLRDGNILIEQLYPGDEDYINHFYSVLPAFKDKRYIQCEGKPLFFVYKPKQCPNISHFISLWQKLAKDNGLEGIYFIAIGCSLYSEDSSRTFLNEVLAQGFQALNIVNAYDASVNGFRFRLMRKIFFKTLKLVPDIRPYSYNQFACPIDSDIRVIPTLLPNWDHTPRSGIKGKILYGSSPEKFQEFLHLKLQAIQDKPFNSRFLIIKSWNEWAEGNYLEPDLRYGRGFLEALKKELFTAKAPCH